MRTLKLKSTARALTLNDMRHDAMRGMLLVKSCYDKNDAYYGLWAQLDDGTERDINFGIELHHRWRRQVFTQDWENWL